MSDDDTSFRGADGRVRAARELDRIGWDALWRPSPGFVGPVMPPMTDWQRRGEPRDGFLFPKAKQLSFSFESAA